MYTAGKAYLLKRFAEVSTYCESRIRLRAKTSSQPAKVLIVIAHRLNLLCDLLQLLRVAGLAAATSGSG